MNTGCTKKIWITIFAAIIIIIAAAVSVSAETEPSQLIPRMEGNDTFNEICEQIFSGSFNIEPSNVFERILLIFTEEIKECSGLIITFVVIGVLSAVINITGSRESGEMALFAVITIMSGLALKCFFTAVECGIEVIDTMCSFITKIAPMIIMLLMSGGNAISAAAFHPVLSAAVYIITLICRNCIIPLVCVSAVLCIVNNLNTDLRISNFCRLINSVSKWILTGVFTIFTGISAIYGFSAPALDAMSAKAVKFAVGSLVPVVGGFLSDSLDTVITGTRLAKNAVGTAGVVMIIIMVAVPVVKLCIILLMMKLAAAVVEPVTDKRISGMLWDMAESVTVVLAMVITVAIMFIVAVSIILSATNMG